MASLLNHKPGDWNMMSRLKKFRWTFLAAALSLAATTTADNLKYDKLDWDDDLVPNAQELIDGTSSLDPLKASCAASWASSALPHSRVVRANTRFSYCRTRAAKAS